MIYKKTKNKQLTIYATVIVVVFAIFVAFFAGKLSEKNQDIPVSQAIKDRAIAIDDAEKAAHAAEQAAASARKAADSTRETAKSAESSAVETAKSAKDAQQLINKVHK